MKIGQCSTASISEWILEEIEDPRPAPEFPPGHVMRIEARNHNNGDPTISDYQSRVLFEPFPYDDGVKLETIGDRPVFDTMQQEFRFNDALGPRLNLSNTTNGSWTHAYWLYPKPLLETPPFTGSFDTAQNLYFWRMGRGYAGGDERTRYSLDPFFIDGWAGTETRLMNNRYQRDFFRSSQTGQYSRAFFPNDGWQLVILSGHHEQGIGDTQGNSGETFLHRFGLGDQPMGYRAQSYDGRATWA